MEKSTPIGVLLGFGLIFGTILLGQGATVFFSIPSAIIVFGGTFAGLLVSYTMAELIQIVGSVKEFVSYRPPNMKAYVKEFTDLSRLSRRDGLLALDRELGNIEDPYMKAGLELAVDGIDEAELDEIMRSQMIQEMERTSLSTRFFNSAGIYSPAFGMIGTLIGLIQMLQGLDDPAQIGPGMALALITTFYGAMLANVLFLPLASKIKNQGKAILKSREMILAGTMAIVRGESPTMVEKKLRMFLPEGDQKEFGDEELSTMSRAA